MAQRIASHGACSRCWTLTGAALITGAVVGHFLPAQALDWQPGLAWRQPWRWWSAAFVHYGGLHLAANLLATGAVIAWGRVACVPRASALAWLAAWPLAHLVLLAQPALQHYGGLSGTLHAGVAVVAVGLVTNARGMRRGIGVLVLAGLLAKIVGEAPWRLERVPDATFGVEVVPLAHAGGAVAGLLLGALAAWRVRIASAA